MKKTVILEKAGYIKPTIKKVVLTSDERMAGTCDVGSVPPEVCGAAAATAVPDGPVS